MHEFWITHGIACRRIAAEIGRQLGQPVVTIFWIPDGYKDLPFDRKPPRERLEASLDAGHFHPTENLSDKISSVLQFVPGLLLHVSRGVRWDSDHVVLLDDPTRAIMEELVRGDFTERIALGLGFFDASINRIAAWTIGTRNALKALLAALLQPADLLREAEQGGDHTTRHALLEETTTLPHGSVWDEHCRRNEVPVGRAWLNEVKP